MLRFIGVSRNRMIGIGEDKDGKQTPHPFAEVILLLAAPDYVVDALGGVSKQSSLTQQRFGADAACLRTLAQSANDYAAELDELKAEYGDEEVDEAKKIDEAANAYHLMLGEAIAELAAEQSAWSQATFGSDTRRGPLGALKHLEKEAREAQANPTDRTEYADCLLLLLDASRRAGMTALDLVKAGRAKMEVNRQRKWPEPKDDTPVEHVKGGAA